MKLNIVGNIFGSDGYCSHTRQLANAISDVGVEVSLTCGKPEDFLRHTNDNELRMMQRNPEEADAILLVGTPPSWKSFMSEGKKFIGFCVWEGDKVPLFWLDILEDKRVDQIWVPSQHTKSAIICAAVESEKDAALDLRLEDKIRIVPHGVDKSIFKPIEKKNDNFTFTAGKGWPHGIKDRGGLSYLIKAFSEEFTKDEKVDLVVKINAAYGMTPELLERNMMELEIENENKPVVHFMMQNVDYKDLMLFYNKGDVFVNTSLADGFNLNCLESMACGIPVLTTTFGGMSDFVNEKNGWYLKGGEMKEVKWDLMYEGISWKTPDVDEIRKTLRYIFEHQDEVTKKKDICLKDTAKWTWIETGKKAKRFLNELN